MTTLYTSNGSVISIGSGGTSVDTIQGVTTETKFEDFTTTGWYSIPTSWYELVASTFGNTGSNTSSHCGLLRVIAKDTNFIRYEFYPNGVNNKTTDSGVNSNAYGYNAYGYECEMLGYYYPKNMTSITWYRNSSTYIDTIYKKKILLVGDSIPAGFQGLTGFEIKHQCKITNKCNGGTSIAYRTSDKSNEYDTKCLVAITDSSITNNSSQYYLDIENSDALVLWMGTNDYGNNIPIGTISTIGSTFDDNTVIGALQHSIENIISRNPSINIIMLSPMYRYCNSSDSVAKFETYVKAVIDVANLYHIPIKNMYTDCGVNDLNRSGLLDSAGLHPSGTKGVALIRAKYEHWIEQNI